MTFYYEFGIIIPVIEVKIVFYNKTLISGGIEKCLEMLSKYLYKDYEIEVVYTDDSILDMNIVNIIKQYANVHKIKENEPIICGICVWCYLYFDYNNLKKIIKAKKYFAWIHSMPRILPDCQLDNPQFVEDCDEFICVSEAVKNHLNIKKEGKVIHNFIELDKNIIKKNENPFINYNNVLKLTVVSRLSSGKGFERLFILCDTLVKQNIPFKVLVVGKGRKREKEIKDNFSCFKEVEFVGYKENPFSYIKNADYLVQLSDDESWCNSITEAKSVGTPIIVTNFESAKEQVIDDYNGIVIDLKETDYTKYIPRILDEKNRLRKNLNNFKYENEIDKWLELIEK